MSEQPDTWEVVEVIQQPVSPVLPYASAWPLRNWMFRNYPQRQFALRYVDGIRRPDPTGPDQGDG